MAWCLAGKVFACHAGGPDGLTASRSSRWAGDSVSSECVLGSLLDEIVSGLIDGGCALEHGRVGDLQVVQVTFGPAGLWSRNWRQRGPGVSLREVVSVASSGACLREPAAGSEDGARRVDRG